MQRFTGEGDAPNRLDAILVEHSTNCAPRVRLRIGELSALWMGWMMAASLKRSNPPRLVAGGN